MTGTQQAAPDSLHAGPANTPSSTMRLELGGELTRIGGTAIGPGLDRLQRDYFRGGQPLALSMENAIADIEDMLATVPRALHGIAVSTQEPAMRVLATAAGLGPQAPTLTREAVEQLFARQSAVALGRPATSERLPQDAFFVPALLLVREMMHHLDIAALHLNPDISVSLSKERFP
ncbi:hypothetical protein [Stenotrophomonas sp. NPDC077659]|uniref:hypothetical protein n=1 Tax=Stenotrophomonas sp. NPDC077659 TaxID=3390694 RepID=UPI003CFE216F